MKRTRFYFVLLASLCVLLITACTKGRDAFEYYFLFESYFVPRGVNENSLYHGTYSISLTTLPSNFILRRITTESSSVLMPWNMESMAKREYDHGILLLKSL